MDFRLIDIHTHIYRQQENIISIFSLPIDINSENLPKDGTFSIGWHPWFLSVEKEEDVFKKLDIWSSKKQILAIGETGLDRLSKVPIEYQVYVFQKHINLSEREKKPLIIHCVKCFSEIIEIKKQLKPQMPWIIHGFNNKIEIAEKLLNENIKLSFGKALVNPKSNASIIIPELKLSDFFLETDDSEISIDQVYEIASMRRNIKIQELMQMQNENFKITFNTL